MQLDRCRCVQISAAVDAGEVGGQWYPLLGCRQYHRFRQTPKPAEDQNWTAWYQQGQVYSASNLPLKGGRVAVCMYRVKRLISVLARSRPARRSRTVGQPRQLQKPGCGDLRRCSTRKRPFFDHASYCNRDTSKGANCSCTYVEYFLSLPVSATAHIPRVSTSV